MLTTFAGRRAGAQTQLAETTRAKVQQLSVERRTRVEVKLQDDTKLKGYITQAGADSFSVTDAKTGTTRTIAYTEVTQVKKSSGGLSPLTWGLIGGAVAAAVVVGIIVKPAVCDGGAQTRFPC
jgi:hypothetical protein